MKKLDYSHSEADKDLERKQKEHFSKLLSKRIRLLRKKHSSLSQEQLAQESGLNMAYISHLERGVYTPSAYVIWKIAETLGISLSEFFKDFPEK